MLPEKQLCSEHTQK